MRGLRTLLATTAVLALATAAEAQQVSGGGGVAFFTLPPLPGMVYQATTGFSDTLVSIDAPAFGMAPAYGGGIDVPINAKFGVHVSAFYASTSSSVVLENLLADGGALTVQSLYPSDFSAFATATYDPPGATAGGVGGPSAWEFFVVQEPTDPAMTPVFGYSTVFGVNGSPVPEPDGVLIAAAGIFPKGALTLTETASMRYLGGQVGVTAAIGPSGGATAFVGGIYRSLDQQHLSQLVADFEVEETDPEPITTTILQTATTEERLHSTYYGTLLGLSLDKTLNGWLSAGIDLGVAPLLMVTNYTGQQTTSLTFENNPVLGTQPEITEKLYHAAALGTVRSRLGFNLGQNVQVTLSSFAEFLSAVPTLDRSVTSSGQLAGGSNGWSSQSTASAEVAASSPGAGQPFVIGFRPMMSYGATLSLTLGFGGP